MAATLVTIISVLLSAAAVTGVVYLYYRFTDRFSRVSKDISDLKRDINSMQIESKAFGDEEIDEDMDQDELFEENVRKLAERLFVLLKTKHDMDDVTTYREMEEVVQDMDTEDEQLKEELMKFYDSAIRLEYSDEELSDEERERMKQTAIDLIKRTGQVLE